MALDGYQAAYERGHAEFFQTFSSGLESLYQQLHAATAETARLVGAAAKPAVDVTSLAGLDDYVARHPTEQLASQVEGIRREVRLLSWICTVRNKAVQHRHENGYTGNRAMVPLDGFAVMRKPLPATPEIVRKARGMLRGLVRPYGIALDTETGDVEMITYLDFVSHSLYAVSRDEFDRARAVVAEAAAHDLVVSLPFLATVDQALAALIALAPEMRARRSQTWRRSAAKRSRQTGSRRDRCFAAEAATRRPARGLLVSNKLSQAVVKWPA